MRVLHIAQFVTRDAGTMAYDREIDFASQRLYNSQQNMAPVTMWGGDLLTTRSRMAAASELLKRDCHDLGRQLLDGSNSRSRHSSCSYRKIAKKAGV